MKKQKMTPTIGIAFGILILLVVAFMVQKNLQQAEKIVLPPEPTVVDPEKNEDNTDVINRIDVHPDTVQRAVETLLRPEVYTRTITVERYWDGGSSVTVTTVYVAGEWMRLDEVEANGEIRHTILGGGMSYIWYGNERKYYSGLAVLDQDAEQGILTYEEILDLPVEKITRADYEELEGLKCIYVEAQSEEEGYIERYWVNVETGLLVAAEKVCNEAVVYRMAALNISQDAVDQEIFTLPDNLVLYNPQES